jgi:hypothetical protein
MSRVYPLPSTMRKKIIELFCPQNLRNHPSVTAPKAHLARILLGRPVADSGRTAPQRFFDTYNFPLTRDRAELLGIDTVQTAREMGRLLAQMHMTAKNDARDIKIVLGANVTNGSMRHREARVWVIDFNQVSSFDRTEAQIPSLVQAFFANEAYFPRPHPGDRLYQEFVGAYTAECGKINEVAVKLGQMFILALGQEQLSRRTGQ